jgi:hypothetical protein
VCAVLVRLQAGVNAAAVWLFWQGEALMLQRYMKLSLCSAQLNMFHDRVL